LNVLFDGLKTRSQTRFYIPSCGSAPPDRPRPAICVYRPIPQRPFLKMANLTILGTNHIEPPRLIPRRLFRGGSAPAIGSAAPREYCCPAMTVGSATVCATDAQYLMLIDDSPGRAVRCANGLGKGSPVRAEVHIRELNFRYIGPLQTRRKRSMAT
jgi:hypothetical protein